MAGLTYAADGLRPEPPASQSANSTQAREFLAFCCLVAGSRAARAFCILFLSTEVVPRHFGPSATRVGSSGGNAETPADSEVAALQYTSASAMGLFLIFKLSGTLIRCGFADAPASWSAPWIPVYQWSIEVTGDLVQQKLRKNDAVRRRMSAHRAACPLHAIYFWRKTNTSALSPGSSTGAPSPAAKRNSSDEKQARDGRLVKERRCVEDCSELQPCSTPL
ncbi:hypothetical protein Emed_003664 [Eimeria media]